ncbi:MAG: hypothetical protein R3B93_24435 [Bacteroidia bacterium]
MINQDKHNTPKNTFMSLLASSEWFIKIPTVFLVIFLSQIPGCVIVLWDDAGHISYLEYEHLIEFSKITVAFPLKLAVNSINSDGQLLLLYMANLFLLTGLVIMAISAWKRIRNIRLSKNK